MGTTQTLISSTVRDTERDETFTLAGESLPALVVGNQIFRLYNGGYWNDLQRYHRDPRYTNRAYRRRRGPYHDPDDEKGMKLLIALLTASAMGILLQLVF